VVNDNDHPRDEEIAAFLDGGLSAADRATVSRHLAVCDDCRALLGALPEQPRTKPLLTRGRAGLLLWPALAGVAAALLIAVNLSSRSRRPTGDADPLRGDTALTIEGSVLGVSSPADGARVPVDSLVFRWSSAGTGATYHFSIVDAVGDAVWSAEVGTNDIVLPAATVAGLRAEATYYWRVDAMLQDLRTASTGPQGFVPLRR
jgi:anti-sigma factor RsiW